MSVANYSSFSEERYKSAFAVKLREKLLQSPEDVKNLAEYLGCSVQAINQYKLGQSMPKVENLIKIAQFYNCSLDNLIGLSDVESTSPTIQNVCEYTGLSERAVEHLHNCVEGLQKDNSYYEIVSDLLSNDEFYHSIAYLKRAKRVEAQIADQKKTNPEGFNILQSFAESFSDREIMSDNSNNGVRLSHRQSIEFYLQCASDCFRRLCGHIVKGEKQ